MAGKSHGIQTNQSSTNYVNKKGINELFEAIMTALMVHKPDDHIAFIRECLDKVQNNPQRVRWDFFVTNTSNIKGALPSRPSIVRNRQKPLPPVVRNSNSTIKINQTSDRRKPVKQTALPPIENNNNKKNTLNLPIIFILSLSNSTKICSRLLERYNQITYLYINDIANINDDDENIDLKKYEHRYDSLQHHIDQHGLNTQGFLIAGHLNEKDFCQNWQNKLGHIDLIILLSTDRQEILNQDLHFIQIDSTNDLDTILANVIRSCDEIFSQNTFVNNDFQLIQTKSNHFNLPIIFCIDNHRLLIKESSNNKFLPRPSIDQEFDMTIDENEEEINNSFIYMLSERLAEQFSFKHIHYGDFNKRSLNFEQLKTIIIESMSTTTGYIIDHFPTSFDDLRKFQNDIGPCSVLIYIGEHQTQTKDDELNDIVEKFKEINKAIYIDCGMEVDEIYEDLKNDILKHI